MTNIDKGFDMDTLHISQLEFGFVVKKDPMNFHTMIYGHDFHKWLRKKFFFFDFDAKINFVFDFLLKSDFERMNY